MSYHNIKYDKEYKEFLEKLKGNFPRRDYIELYNGDMVFVFGPTEDDDGNWTEESLFILYLLYNTVTEDYYKQLSESVIINVTDSDDKLMRKLVNNFLYDIFRDWDDKFLSDYVLDMVPYLANDPGKFVLEHATHFSKEALQDLAYTEELDKETRDSIEMYLRMGGRTYGK